LSEPDISYGTEESPNGEYVRYADYAALKAENKRLRKAGDALLECHKIRDDLAYSIQEQSPDVAKAMLAWLSAKETRP
jgi:hypothetical protein